MNTKEEKKTKQNKPKKKTGYKIEQEKEQNIDEEIKKCKPAKCMNCHLLLPIDEEDSILQRWVIRVCYFLEENDASHLKRMINFVAKES